MHTDDTPLSFYSTLVSHINAPNHKGMGFCKNFKDENIFFTAKLILPAAKFNF